jgi:hypothetical protein
MAGALAAAPFLLLSLIRRPLGIAAAAPVFCALAVFVAPFAAPNTKEARAQRAVGLLAAAVAVLAAWSRHQPWAGALGCAAAGGVLLRARFRAPAEFVSLRKPPTAKGL